MKDMEKNTIAAIASGIASSGIGIIRISGDDAVKTAEKVVRVKGGKNTALEDRRAVLCTVFDGEEVIDEAIVLVMKGPHSYTGEDVAEIQCHGGPYVMKRVLDAVIHAGARNAQPGEFTKRAFLNGRIDLSQAEAVMDLIKADSEFARKAAVSQLKGALKEKVTKIRQKLIYDTAYLEAALDDPEHISLEGYRERLLKTVSEASAEIEKLIDTSENGRVLKEGIKTAILGRPNAGKSTLLNLLLGQERAIVTKIPGTTRDTLEESARLGDITLRLVDTAGIRQARDEVEKIGVKKAVETAKMAALILFVIDGGEEFTAEDEKTYNDIKNITKQTGAPIITLINKIDKNRTAPCGGDFENVIMISAKTGEGKDLLEEKIKDLFYHEKIKSSQEQIIAGARQKEELSRAAAALKNVREAIENNMPEDLFTVDLMDAYDSLGRITGETADEDLINQIFESFCMGK